MCPPARREPCWPGKQENLTFLTWGCRVSLATSCDSLQVGWHDIASDTPRPHLRSRSTPCSSPLATHDWTIHLSAYPVNPSHTYHQTLSSSSTCTAFCVASNTPFQCCLSPAARPLRDGPKHRTWLPYRAPARKVTMREDGWKGESIKEKVSKMH